MSGTSIIAKFAMSLRLKQPSGTEIHYDTFT